AFGMAGLNQRGGDSVHRYVGDFQSLTRRSAVWIDTKDAYWTLDNDYIESVWWLLGRLWDDGLLYEGYRVTPYCARCGTALSSHELGQPGAYRDITDLSVYVRFPVENRDFDLLVWTTTPWTLISNVAAAVGPDMDYVRVRSSDGGRDLVLAAARAGDDAEIVEGLRGRGVLVREEPYLHSYPHCWRCGTPLIYWAKTSWFVRTAERRADLLRENERIGWHPEHIKHGRFGDWLENNVDWALSRDRYWGTPLPIWRCGQGHDTCVGTVDELRTLAGSDLAGLDLHRPYVDDVTITCPAEGCGAEARRVVPVIDAWFDSGSMPSAQHHFLGESPEPPDFPADSICEASDQTR